MPFPVDPRSPIPHDLAGLDRLIRLTARDVDLELEDAAVGLLVRFAGLFWKWNQRINLASISSPQELIERHFVDSYVATKFVPPGSGVIDVGSGGGLPALPLAALRGDVSLRCFEPIHKKAAFLRTATRELGLTGRVLVQSEAVHRPVPTELAFGADVAMSRATLDPGTWLELGRDLIRPGGRVLVFTTAHSEESLPAAARTASYARNRRLLCFE